MFRTIATFTFAAITVVAASAASAHDASLSSAPIAIGEPGPREEVIDYSRVDFSNAAQVKAFYRSLEYAAARVCVDESRACHADVVTDAVRRINRQELSALHQGGEPATQMASADR